jgi:hypothetical protein
LLRGDFGLEEKFIIFDHPCPLLKRMRGQGWFFSQTFYSYPTHSSSK